MSEEKIRLSHKEIDYYLDNKPDKERGYGFGLYVEIPQHICTRVREEYSTYLKKLNYNHTTQYELYKSLEDYKEPTLEELSSHFGDGGIVEPPSDEDRCANALRYVITSALKPKVGEVYIDRSGEIQARTGSVKKQPYYVDNSNMIKYKKVTVEYYESLEDGTRTEVTQELTDKMDVEYE